MRKVSLWNRQTGGNRNLSASNRQRNWLCVKTGKTQIANASKLSDNNRVRHRPRSTMKRDSNSTKPHVAADIELSRIAVATLEISDTALF